MRALPKYSVVMSVYRGDTPAHLREALASILQQTLPPSELLIVIDGPVDKGIEDILTNITSAIPVRIVRSPQNVGVGAARHLGIVEAKHSIIGVMDADDISVLHRFKRQLELLEYEEVDIVGGSISEFDESLDDVRRIRTVPMTHQEIYEYGKWRSPMNHVTIMFKRLAYQNAGGYRPIRCFEDYDLFVRMIKAGVRFKNVPEVLVHVRCGTNMIRRRGGVKHIATELRVLWGMYKCGYTNGAQFLGNALIRIPIRLMPSHLRFWFYSRFLRRRHSYRDQC